MSNEKVVSGVIFDPIAKEKISGIIKMVNGRIESIDRDEKITSPLILPGFVDSHIHIESSMLIPAEFSRIALRHGTIAVVADPHEIANVAGVEGIDFMIANSKLAEIKFFFGAPSCVPATPHDDCFQILDSPIIKGLMKREDIYFLGEMMNFPGVINSDKEAIEKINAALGSNKPVDGHAPGLSSVSLKKYFEAGITTDHECFTMEEASEKIKLGMKVLIREGSAAKNFDALNPLITEFPKSVMLCTDDCHPEDLINGHINIQVKRSLALGHDIFDVLQVACVNPVEHYKLNIGLLQVGDPADFIVVDNLETLNVMANYINGSDVLDYIYKDPGKKKVQPPGYAFSASLAIENLSVNNTGEKIRVIEIIEGELVTNTLEIKPLVETGKVISDTKNDVLKVVVVNRYKKNKSFVGFIKGFGMIQGAIAESIAHDSHHIIAVGVDDISIFRAIEYVIRNKGGVCYCSGIDVFGLPLTYYGLMSNDSAENIANSYEQINRKVISDGCKLKAPFMTLSFMALSVIPTLKITPKGLFDVIQFKNTELFIQ